MVCFDSSYQTYNVKLLVQGRSMKDWIMQYAEVESDDNEDDVKDGYNDEDNDPVGIEI